MTSSSNDIAIFCELKNRLKKSKTIIDLFDKNHVDLKIINWIPMRFSESLDVSARTQHGIISFNAKLRDKLDDLDMYGAHEITHVLDQCFSDKPTQGAANDEDYLSNKHEQKAFREQTKFITEKDGPVAAEDYIEKVLKHHEVPQKEWDEKKDDLLRTASKQMKLDFYADQKKKPVDIKKVEEFLNKLETGEFEDVTPRYIPNTKIPDTEKQYRLKKLKNILDILEKKAGLLGIPPNFPIEEVNSWLESVTTGRVMVIAKRSLQFCLDILNLNKIRESYQKLLNFYFEDGGKLDLQIRNSDNLSQLTDLHYEIKKLPKEKYFLNLNGKIYNSLSYDKAEQLLWGSKGEFAELVNKYKDILPSDILENLSSDQELKEQIVELHLLLKECQKYNPIKQWNVRAIKTIDYYNDNKFNITYGTSWQDLRRKDYDAEGIYRLFNDTHLINLVLNPDSILDCETLKAELQELKKTFDHELKHAYQNILNSGKGGGLPPKNTRNYYDNENTSNLVSKDDSNHEDRKELYKKYVLDDIEFYTKLKDEVSNFKNLFGKLDQSTQNDLFKLWVSLPIQLSKDKEFYKKYIDPDSFFNILKELNPGKWKKAVKEFWKAIHE